MEPRKPVANPKFIIHTKFKNKKGGFDIVPILNHDGYIDIAHQFGLISLTAVILRQWETRTPAGQDEYGNEKEDVTRWAEVQATCVVKGGGLGETITATGLACANDRDKFVKLPQYLIAVAETRAKNRAIASACNVTEDTYSPANKGPDREAHDLPPIPTGDEEEPEGIPQEIRRPNISPPLSRTPTHPGHSEETGDLWT